MNKFNEQNKCMIEIILDFTLPCQNIYSLMYKYFPFFPSSKLSNVFLFFPFSYRQSFTGL